MTENMEPTKDLSGEAMERIVNLIKEGNLQWDMAKVVSCYNSAVFLLRLEYKIIQVV